MMTQFQILLLVTAIVFSIIAIWIGVMVAHYRKDKDEDKTIPKKKKYMITVAVLVVVIALIFSLPYFLFWLSSFS